MTPARGRPIVGRLEGNRRASTPLSLARDRSTALRRVARMARRARDAFARAREALTRARAIAGDARTRVAWMRADAMARARAKGNGTRVDAGEARVDASDGRAGCGVGGGRARVVVDENARAERCDERTDGDGGASAATRARASDDARRRIVCARLIDRRASGGRMVDVTCADVARTSRVGRGGAWCERED